MRCSRIKQKLRADQPALVTTLHLTDQSLFEMTSTMGFDGIWMDLEHHGYSVETAIGLMRAARIGVSDIVARPAKGEFMRMGRLLEAGAQAIMYPRCDNAEEAANVVRWSKFAPLGQRGFDGAGADNPYCNTPMAEYVRRANEETTVIIQIESPAALKHADEIAAVEGVDVLMLGPGDFSILAGVPGDFDAPVVRDAVARVADAAKKAGKHWAATVGTNQRMAELIKMGARILCRGADIIHVKNGLEQLRRDAESIGFTFELPDQQAAGSYMERA